MRDFGDGDRSGLLEQLLIWINKPIAQPSSALPTQ